MADLPTITRVISGKGTITIPPSYARASQVVLYTQVIRENSSVYRSFSKNPSESFFANITLNWQGFVLDSKQIEYDSQYLEIWNGTGYALMSALQCLEKSIIDKFVLTNIEDAALVPLLSRQFLESFRVPGFIYDQIKFVCFGGTAIRLTLKGFEQEQCNGEDSPPPFLPPSPPLPAVKIPPGTPINFLDLPEEEAPNDTQPFPGDEELPSFSCTPAVYTSTAIQPVPGGEPVVLVAEVLIWLPVLNFVFQEMSSAPGQWEAGVVCGGLQTGVCSIPTTVSLFGGLVPQTTFVNEILTA